MPVLIRRVAGGLLAIALVVGPLDYASTRPGSTWLLIALLGIAAFSWASSLVLEQRIPTTPLPVLFGLLALAGAAAFWICAPGLATPAAEFTSNHFAHVMARWPESVVNFEPGAVIALHAGFGLALWMTMDLARDRNWSLILAATMVAVGGIVALLAIAQNMTHATGIFWQTGTRLPGRFWGTFFHHTSAGAYLNTVWPLAAGFALIAAQLGLPPVRKKLAVSLAILVLILLLGAHATHISRFPQFAAIALAPFLMLGLMRKNLFHVSRAALAVPVGIVAIALVAGRTDEIARRWRLLETAGEKSARAIPPENAWPRLVRADLLIPNVYNSGTWGDRGEAQRTALRAIAARPLSGHGPGNWSGAASRFSSDPYVRSFYLYLQFAHEDFLQTWTEWGVAGFVSLVTLLPGAVIVAGRSELLADRAVSIVVLCAAAGLAMVLLQSLLDFPLQIPAISLNASVLAGLGWSTRTLPRPLPLPL